jgi:hypothetical protein
MTGLREVKWRQWATNSFVRMEGGEICRSHLGHFTGRWKTVADRLGIGLIVSCWDCFLGSPPIANLPRHQKEPICFIYAKMMVQ